MASLALAAIGRDRPGIVATVSRVLFDLGCNVEDSSMTLLRGNFAIMLVFACPPGRTAAEMDDALRDPCAHMGLTYSVLEIDDLTTVPQPTHVLTVYGGDRPGILFRTCEVLAHARVNITDLDSRLVGEPDTVYALVLELEIPEATNVTELGQTLHAVAAEMGVDVILHEREADVL